MVVVVLALNQRIGRVVAGGLTRMAGFGRLAHCPHSTTSDRLVPAVCRFASPAPSRHGYITSPPNTTQNDKQEKRTNSKFQEDFPKALKGEGGESAILEQHWISFGRPRGYCHKPL